MKSLVILGKPGGSPKIESGSGLVGSPREQLRECQVINDALLKRPKPQPKTGWILTAFKWLSSGSATKGSVVTATANWSPTYCHHSSAFHCPVPVAVCRFFQRPTQRPTRGAKAEGKKGPTYLMMGYDQTGVIQSNHEMTQM